MPKLDKEQAKRVEDNDGSFPPLEEGMYVGTLMEVRVSDQPGDSGYPFWTWIFSELFAADDEDWDNPTSTVPGSAFHVTSLSPKSEFKMAETFQAFGVPADTDTDDLIGEKIRLYMEQRVIEKGPRAGQIGNNVANLFPLMDESGGSTPEPEPEPTKPVRGKQRAAARA
jgi:hypothetical protein